MDQTVSLSITRVENLPSPDTKTYKLSQALKSFSAYNLLHTLDQLYSTTPNTMETLKSCYNFTA